MEWLEKNQRKNITHSYARTESQKGGGGEGKARSERETNLTGVEWVELSSTITDRLDIQYCPNHTASNMCQAKRLPTLDSSYSSPPSQDKIRAARKIVKKYRKHEEKRELEKLRQLLPPAKNGGKLRKKEVIDETITMIMELEKQLMAKIMRQGSVPSQLVHTGLQPNSLNLDSLRTAMAMVMPQRPYLLPVPATVNFAGRH